MNAPERYHQFAPTVPKRGEKMSHGEFIALIAAMFALAGLALDIMLPALPQIGEALGLANANNGQAVIIVYMFGFAIGQFAFGRMSDLYGRKPVFLGGMAVFVAGSLLATLSSDFGPLLLARSEQGVGAAAMRVIAVALVRDRYTGREMGRVMSIGMAVFFSVPVLAPSIGLGLLMVGTWPLIFGFLFVCGIILTVWSGLRLPESAAAVMAKPLPLMEATRRALKTPQTVGYAAASGLMFACTLSLISSAQQVFADSLGVGDRLSLAFAAIAILIAGASLTSAMLVERFGMRRLSHASLAAFVVVAGLVVAATLTGQLSIWVFVGAMASLFLLFGFVVPNFNALAMEPQGGQCGHGLLGGGIRVDGARRTRRRDCRATVRRHDAAAVAGLAVPKRAGVFRCRLGRGPARHVPLGPAAATLADGIT